MKHKYPVRSFYDSHWIVVLWIVFAGSCSTQYRLAQETRNRLLNDSSLLHAHTGICIYEPASSTYWLRHQSDRYFIPASNTKLFSLYAGLRFLGDRLPAARVVENQGQVYFSPAADPTFLHPAYSRQPLLDFLLKAKDTVYLCGDLPVTPWGYGWTWDDYDQDYAAERSAFPVFGNQVWFNLPDTLFANHYPQVRFSRYVPSEWKTVRVTPGFFEERFTIKPAKDRYRLPFHNQFTVDTSGNQLSVPFITNQSQTAIAILSALLEKPVEWLPALPDSGRILYSQPTDTVLRDMMFESDNFFAEQTLLMAALKHTGTLNEQQMIDTLLKTDLAQLPQRPKWVDGSGLSRYNLFTPEDLVFILEKMHKEFGLERLKKVLPSGGTGTLRGLYAEEAGSIFAKTGTLSNQVALSGFLITKKGKLLVFSVMAGNHGSRAARVRKAFEQYIRWIRREF